jgi:putative FmdB family regulatory protein
MDPYPPYPSQRYPRSMPMYEYQCRECHHLFELLVREQTVLACPACDGRELDRQLSVFAVGGDSPKFNARGASPGPCGSCGDPRGPGSCSMN